MDTKKLEALAAAVEHGSFTRAAEALGYTQSGMTHMMNSLERDIGFPVLLRGRAGVRLTPAGERIYPLVRQVLSASQALDREITLINSHKEDTIRVAAYSSIATHWLPAVIRAFQKDYPHVSIRLMEGIWQEVSAWLDERTADIGFFSYQEGMPYEWIPLAEDPMLALLPPDHPLAGAASYPLKNCEEDPFIMPALGCDDDVEALFRRNGIVPKIRFTTMESFSAMSMVEQGLGISVMNRLITEKHICNVVKLPVDPPSRITMGVALHSKTDASPAVKMFLKYAVRMLTRTEET